jgi:hypothetical protein
MASGTTGAEQATVLVVYAALTGAAEAVSSTKTVCNGGLDNSDSVVGD